MIFKIKLKEPIPTTMNNVDLDRFIYDYAKGLTGKELALKYGIKEAGCYKFLRDNKDVFDKYNNLDKEAILIDYIEGTNIRNLTISYGIDKRIVYYVLQKHQINNNIRSLFIQNRVRPYSKSYTKEELQLVSDLYHSGYPASYLKDNCNITSGLIAEAITHGSSSEIIEDKDQVVRYQNLLSEAYDLSIINNDMLLRLFSMNVKDVNDLKNDGICADDFVSNKLYQIYYCPYLMNKFNFTDEFIEAKAKQFLNRRYEEDVKPLMSSKNKKMRDRANNLFNLYYNPSKKLSLGGK